ECEGGRRSGATARCRRDADSGLLEPDGRSSRTRSERGTPRARISSRVSVRLEHDMLAYVPIFLFAIIEGEIYYIAMCVAAAAGNLNCAGVMVAGALGGSAGDQFWFYLLRGRIHWLDRSPRLARYRDVVIHRVRANQTLMVLISRFLPGLRVAIPIACAYAGVRAVRFSALNLISAFAW